MVISRIFLHFFIQVNDIHRHHIWLQLQRAFGAQEFAGSGEDIIKFADSLVCFYEETAHFSAEMAPTDIRPNDTYLILAAHYYIEGLGHLVTKISTSSDEQKELLSFTSNSVVKLCCLLEHGIEVSKANYHLKLLLLKAYNLIGKLC